MSNDSTIEISSGVPSDPELSLGVLFGILRRRIMSVAVLGVLGTSLAILAANQIPAKYTALALIEILPPLQSEAGGREWPGRVDQSAVDTHTALLTSQDFIEKVTRGLSKLPRSAKPSSPSDSRQPPADSSKRQRPTKKNDATTGLFEFQMPSLRFVNWSDPDLTNYEGFMKKFSVNQHLTSRVIVARFTSTDPVRAADIVNHAIQTYVADQFERAKLRARSEVEQLNRRMEILNVSILSVQRDIRKLLGENPKGETDTSTLKQLAELKEKEVWDTQLLGRLRARKSEQIAQLGSIRRPIRTASRAAPPNRPSSLPAILFVLPGALLSFLLACMYVVVSALFDRRMRSVADVETGLGLPCSGLVPKLSRSFMRSINQDAGFLVQAPREYLSVVRTIVANQGLLASNDDSKTILLTSSLPGEGKSTLALSLAGVLARLGKRVIVVDFDSTKSEVQCPETETGNAASDIGQVDLSTIDKRVQRMSVPGAYRLHLADLSTDPLVMFGTGDMAQILMNLRSQYDRVIVDGPAVQDYPEVGLLAEFADRLLLIVAWGETPKDVVATSLRSLEHFVAPERSWSETICAVLTKSPR